MGMFNLKKKKVSADRPIPLKKPLAMLYIESYQRCVPVLYHRETIPLDVCLMFSELDKYSWNTFVHFGGALLV